MNSVNAVVANAVGATINTSNSPTAAGTFGLLVVGLLILIGTGAAIVWSQWTNSPWLPDSFSAVRHIWDWLPSANTLTSVSSLGELQTTTSAPAMPGAPPTHSLATRGGTTETWCFVGEDYTGRWCVQVPNSDSCTPGRTYPTQNDCQLVEASHMPAGILKNGGATMDPLRNNFIA